MEIFLATTNAGKKNEILEVFGSNSRISFITIQDIEERTGKPFPVSKETGMSYQENALQKALHAFEYTKIPSLAEDSGIQVEVLKNELGVKTRRWGAGENATDEEWISFFLNRMKNESNRKACFFASACFVQSLENISICSGTMHGTLLKKSLAPLPNGIPLSAYFVPDGYSFPISQISCEEKKKISHRGKAFMNIKKVLLG